MSLPCFLLLCKKGFATFFSAYHTVSNRWTGKEKQNYIINVQFKNIFIDIIEKDNNWLTSTIIFWITNTFFWGSRFSLYYYYLFLLPVIFFLCVCIVILFLSYWSLLIIILFYFVFYEREEIYRYPSINNLYSFSYFYFVGQEVQCSNVVLLSKNMISFSFLWIVKCKPSFKQHHNRALFVIMTLFVNSLVEKGPLKLRTEILNIILLLTSVETP